MDTIPIIREIKDKFIDTLNRLNTHQNVGTPAFNYHLNEAVWVFGNFQKHLGLLLESQSFEGSELATLEVAKIKAMLDVVQTFRDLKPFQTAVSQI